MIFKTGNGIILPTSRPLIKNLLLQNVSHFYWGLQNWFLKIISPTSSPLIEKHLLHDVSNFCLQVQSWFWKQEMKSSKQEMELFLLFPDLRSKNFFCIWCLNFGNDFKAGFQNRKWNYPNRKLNSFSYFPTSD